MIYQKFLNKHLIINLLFSFIPISFILGNLILNLNIALLIITTLFIYRASITNLNLNYFDKIILFFFSYILITGLFNFLISDIPNRNEEILFKTLLYLRFLLIYFIFRFLINEKIINFNLFFSVCSISVIFVSLDLIYQFYNGYDIFGFEGNSRRLGGPFGDEKVAGPYLYRFSFFLLFALLTFSYFKKLNSYLSFAIYLLASLLIILGIIYAGNRMPFFMFLFTCFLIFLIKRENKIHFLSIIILSFGILFVHKNTNMEINKHYGHFQTKVKAFLKSFSKENLINDNGANLKSFDEKNYVLTFNNKTYRMSSGHVKEFYSGFKTWKSKPFFGGGVKTFKHNCPKVFFNCTTHPHNYYLEILADLGLVGLLIVILIFSILIVKALSIKDIFITPFIFVFISEVFPLKSTGSFFTSSNSTFIFLFLAIIAGITFKKKIE